ncbi:SPOR domain-containing protein [Hydrogenophaga atypica]|uniref:SPOR domain-containing protein n=1 Tax=Hydrogenophaga atypica TaxID=249409 RepID=A0ABW2QQL3_9BURK
MLRLFALVMLLANAGYFAWSQGHLRTLGWGPVEQREPERLAQQMGADKLRLEGSAPTPAPSPAPTTPAAAATEATTCQAVAGLSPAQATAVTTALVGAGLDDKHWALDESVLPERWIVYVGKFPSADLLNRKKTELRSLRVEFRDVNAPALQPGLALGTYSTEAAAQTALQELGRSGVRSAKVTKEREEQRSVAVRLPALTEAERARVEPLVQQAAGKPLAACP